MNGECYQEILGVRQGPKRTRPAGAPFSSVSGLRNKFDTDREGLGRGIFKSLSTMERDGQTKLSRLQAKFPAFSNIEFQEDNRCLSLSFAVVLSSFAISAFFASIYCRGLYSDGAYYLYRVAEHEWFYLVDPARTTVQFLRQLPVVLLTSCGVTSMTVRGQVFSFAMLITPVLLTMLCWWIAPARARGLILFPALHLLVGFSTTSIEAVGEGAIAAAYFWVLLFILLFRARQTLSQLLFLALCIPAFWLHEGACFLMMVLLFACVMRFNKFENVRQRIFLCCSIFVIVCILGYELSWMVYPRIPGARERAIDEIWHLQFIYANQELNLPVLIALCGIAALVGVFTLSGGGELRRRQRRLITVGFAFLVIIASALAWLIHGCVAPKAQAFARYNPIFASVTLGTVTVLAMSGRIRFSRLVEGPACAILIILTLGQLAADLAATARWRAYVTDFRDRLARTSGLVAWKSTLTTGNRSRDINWQSMTVGWVLPILSIEFAENGRVSAIIDYPAGSFHPIDPTRPAELAKLRGVDYHPYVLALSRQPSSWEGR